MKRIAILGSTGSIGTQALSVVAANPRRLKASLLACNTRIDMLRAQIERFRPEAVCVGRSEDARVIHIEYPWLKVYSGGEGLEEAISSAELDVVLNALVGIAGLAPTLAAVRRGGVVVALANKESLVTGGRLVLDMAARAGVDIVPVDSEHSAVFQCVVGNPENSIHRILLTASGGPFRGYTRDQLRTVTVHDALLHPRWSMGRKISVDSATMINKCLEIIEAKWLFDVEASRIEVAVHQQSIIHSLVEFEDGALLAQLSEPDMRIPISYALSWPERWKSDVQKLDLVGLRSLQFEEAKGEARRSLDLAYRVLRDSESPEAKDSGAIVLNGANEELVQLFLDGRIPFTGIVDTLYDVLEKHVPVVVSSVEDVYALDAEARAGVKERYRSVL